MAVESDGDFVVVWQSGGSSGSDTDSHSVQGQHFASDGTTVGGEFQVNSYTTRNQFEPAVAMESDGDFVVVWRSRGSSGSDTDAFSIQGQRFVATAADLSISKDDGVTSAISGQTVTYTIVATNNGPDAASTVAVSDTFPAVLTCSWTSVAAGGAMGNSSASGDLSDTLTMPAGSSVTYTVTCTVDSAATGTLSNTATISSPVIDLVPGNDSATDGDTALVAQADLSISKTAAPDPAPAGGLLTYTLTVTNSGPSDSSGGVVMDVLPAELVFVSSPDCTAAAQTVTCPFAAIPATGSVLLSFTTQVSSAAAQVVNTAMVMGNETDPGSANDTDTANTTVTAPVPAIPAIDGLGFWTLLMLLALAGLHRVRRH